MTEGVSLVLAVIAAASSPPARSLPTPAADPLAVLHGMVVDNIRHCPKPVPGEAVVCARDRGFAEGYRLPKLDPRYEKPVPSSDAAVAVAPPKPCVGTVMTDSGCSIRDYQAWLAWQRLHEKKDDDRR